MVFFSIYPDKLPEPDTEARRHGERVLASLRQKINRADGFISFAEYMQYVLHTPGLGYYSAGQEKLGSAGDFITAPMISSLFSQALSRYLLAVLPDNGAILELGAGSGTMAADILLYLAEHGALPESYLILEPSADLQARQRRHLEQCAPGIADNVEWLVHLPDQDSFTGMIIANEVMDAIPVEHFVLENGSIHQLGVGVEASQLCWKSRLAPPELATQIEARLPSTVTDYPHGYRSAINLLLPDWIKALSYGLKKGGVLLLDYGYERETYYRPDRAHGNLRAYYRHYDVDDMLVYPGLADITAWVDFTTVAESALAAGLQVSGYTTQANFLLENGLTDLARSEVNDDNNSVSTDYLSSAEAIKQLVEPGEMGETVKVITLTKGSEPGPGFGRDMRYRL